MKFHSPSFLLGFASAVVVVTTGKRLRPVLVEIGAVGLHFVQLGRAVLERQREHAEDLWAEVDERVREKRRAIRHVAGLDGEGITTETAHH